MSKAFLESYATMTNQLDRATRLAWSCAHVDIRDRVKPRVHWWVRTRALELGIVDRHGMANVTGLVARTFREQYVVFMKRGR